MLASVKKATWSLATASMVPRDVSKHSRLKKFRLMEGRCWRTTLHVIWVCESSERPLQNLPLHDKVQEQIALNVPLGFVSSALLSKKGRLTSKSS